MSDPESTEPVATPATGRSVVLRRLRALVALIPVAAYTPLLLGAGGFWLNAKQNDMARRLQDYHTTAERMDATSKYFALLNDTSAARAKMGAYAIYMLNRDNPELAVSLILAPERKELRPVLEDLAFRDTMVRQRLVARQVQGPDGGGAPDGPVQETAAPATEAARAADNILRAVPRAGWSYMGNFTGTRWTNGPMLTLPDSRLEQGGTYYSSVRLAIRATAPDPDTYRHGPVTGVIAHGELVRVDTLRRNIKGPHVWAYVTVLPGPSPTHENGSAAPSVKR